MIQYTSNTFTRLLKPIVTLLCILAVLAVAIQTGIIALILPWIVVVTSISGFPNPGVLAQIFLMAWLVTLIINSYFEKNDSHERSALPKIPHGLVHFFSAIRRGNARREAVYWTAVTFIAGLLILVNILVSSSPSVFTSAIKTQRKGNTMLAVIALQPRVSGGYNPGKYASYFFVSSWASSLGEWSLAAKSSLALIKASAFRGDLLVLATGIAQYEMVTQVPVPAAVRNEVLSADKDGLSREAITFLFNLAEVRAARNGATLSIPSNLPDPISGNLVKASDLLISRTPHRLPISQ